MADVPCLDHLWDGWKECPDDGQTRWHKWEVSRSMPICMLLGPLWQSCHAWITHRSVCRVVIVMTDQVTHGTTSHVRLGCAQGTDMGDEHTHVQNTCDKCTNHQNTHIKSTNLKTAKTFTTNVQTV